MQVKWYVSENDNYSPEPEVEWLFSEEKTVVSVSVASDNDDVAVDVTYRLGGLHTNSNGSLALLPTFVSRPSKAPLWHQSWHQSPIYRVSKRAPSSSPQPLKGSPRSSSRWKTPP